jgi:hypothetical protein
MIDEQGFCICDRCGQPLSIGDFPFCPHGRGQAVAFRDDLPGGLVCENYGPTPITFYSHTERRAYMKAHGLQEKETFSPMPGTDKDPQGIPNPVGFTDPQTLANGKALIDRQQRGPAFDGVASGVLRNLTVDVVTDAEEVNRATRNS